MKTLAGLFVLCAFVTVQARAQQINRLASKFHFSSEISTTATPLSGGGGGITFFSKTVFVSGTFSQTPVLFVQIAATGDGHMGAAHAFSCNVDGFLCNPSPTPALHLTGWVALQKHNPTDDLHDNNINYTWCTVTSPGSHTINLKLASSTGGSVFLEGAHIFIDVAPPSGIDACTGF
jgi:hypothetical protein